jgi:hypothetical protein
VCALKFVASNLSFLVVGSPLFFLSLICFLGSGFWVLSFSPKGGRERQAKEEEEEKIFGGEELRSEEEEEGGI